MQRPLLIIFLLCNLQSYSQASWIHLKSIESEGISVQPIVWQNHGKVYVMAENKEVENLHQDLVYIEPRPGMRTGSATWVFEDRLWLFGGMSEGRLMNDLWVYSEGKWKLIDTGEKAPPACMGSFAWADDRLYLFGGYEQENGIFELSNKLFAFDVQKQHWELINTPDAPSPRANMAGWKTKDKTIIYGGLGYTETGNRTGLSDLWEYRSGKWIQLDKNRTYETDFSIPHPGYRINPLCWQNEKGELLMTLGQSVVKYDKIKVESYIWQLDTEKPGWEMIPVNPKDYATDASGIWVRDGETFMLFPTLLNNLFYREIQAAVFQLQTTRKL